jgi:hypothetical protein
VETIEESEEDMTGMTFVRKPGYESIARGTPVDAYLAEEDNLALYKVWRLSWPEPYQFSGGEKSITCEMVVDVGETELALAFSEVFGKTKGAQMAARVYQVAIHNQGR